MTFFQEILAIFIGAMIIGFVDWLLRSRGLQTLSIIFSDACRYRNKCKDYQKDGFNCEHQESSRAVSCGIWRTWEIRNKEML